MNDEITAPEGEIITESEEEIIEDNAEYWAGRVADVLEQTDQEVEPEEALETLAILDAEHNITDHYDPDEFDLFLDEFEEAIEEDEDKKEILDDHIKEAKQGDKAEENDNDSTETEEEE